jgi:hypothetical protein
MDARRFEALVRAVGQVGTRRAVLGVLSSSALGIGLAVRRTEEARAGIPIVNCKPPGKRCDNDTRCCSGKCRRGICSCKPKGKECWAPLEGSLCCSQKCQSGKCT